MCELKYFIHVVQGEGRMWGDVLKRLRDSHMTDLFNDPALPGSCG